MQSFLTENLLAIQVRKTQILMKKPVYLGLSILDLSKTVMYEFWYHYVKPIYGENTKLCYMDRNSIIVDVKTDGIYQDIAEDVETSSVTSSFKLERSFPKEKNKNVMKLWIRWNMN